MPSFKHLLLTIFLVSSCNTGNLKIVSSLNSSLQESSALEKVAFSELLWTIQDSGNKNELYGFNLKGEVKQTIIIDNAKNIDWEDLTTDKQGNIYIGDFGDNDKNRKSYQIYKVAAQDLNKKKTNARITNFTLPKKASENFEAFVFLNNYFYLFTKSYDGVQLFKVPNAKGTFEAELITTHYFDAKDNRITSAALSPDGKTLVLLSRLQLWELSSFKDDKFFSGNITLHPFHYNSQKEGVCFKNDSTVYITDEGKKSSGGNLYTFTFSLK